MGRKTKWCLNLAKGQHLNDKKSPSRHYCSGCYAEMKERYSTIEKQGGPIVGLRAARMLAGGSFGYEFSQPERATNLRAFFYYCMPHIHTDHAERIILDITKGPLYHERETQGGEYIKTKR